MVNGLKTKIMKYYKVKPDFVGVRIQKTYRHTPVITIKNELFTASELKKIGCFTDSMFNTMFESVELSRKKIYFFFGARFENGKGANS